MALFSVKAAGAIGDAKRALGTIAIGTNDLLCGLNPWTAADVGKIVTGVANPLTQIFPTSVITGFVTAGHVTISNVAAFAATGLNPVEITWATQDDTAFFLAAMVAAEEFEADHSPGNPTSGTVKIDSGGYLVDGVIFQNTGAGAVGFLGDGVENTVIYPRPDLVIPGGGAPALIDARGFGGIMKGFSIVCPNWFYTMAADQSLVRFQAAHSWDIDFQLIQAGCIGAGGNAVKLEGCFAMEGRFYIQNAPGSLVHGSGNLMTALCLDQTSGNVYPRTLSNFNRNLKVTNNLVREGGDNVAADAMLNLFGGLVDESTGTNATDVVNHGNLNAFGTTFWGAAVAMNIDGTSKLFATNSDIGPYGAVGGGGSGILLAAGGECRLDGNCSVRGDHAADNIAITNNGKLVIGPSVTFKTGRTGTYVEVPWRTALSSPTTVYRS